ncbi:MAG: DUF1670 domain-containing protein [Dethiobacteria bacterium]|jgi:hypothetical protein|nr:DUF1670 domain-containing protein [Bacillota bacterium]HQE10966.1 DUF1670 domain-containing protein [Bacillota bacterium]
MYPVKGGQNRFAALPARDVRPVQVSHLQQRFELAPRSQLAEAVVHKVNEALAEHETATGAVRLIPGELLVELEGERLPLPLLSPRWSQRLADGCKVAAVRRHLEYEQLQACLAVDQSLTLEHLWRWTDQKELVGRRGGKEFLPAEPLDVETLGVSPRPLDESTLPESLLEPVIDHLAQDYGCKPALARAMAERAAQIRQWCCPRLQELKPGQVVWLVYSTRRSKRGQSRLLAPVVLTLLTLEEQSLTLNNRGDLKHLKVRQLERITAEAWQQDGVLTMLDLEWLLNVNGAFLKQLLTAYQERFGVILPTAGTVLDMGRTLTHKTIVVEMALEGLSTQQIAKRIFHTPEAVDYYLRLFDRVLVLLFFRMPPHLMRQVTGHSLALINEHLALAKKHFPTEKDLVDYLTNRGVDLEKAQ